ncbi:MAG: hypothetical protein NZ901_11320 [Geminocystis sp.]|nr:hypothetical protein [Geminocystis sp.]MCX8078366.1 hypothetical protein [Geminocystis sp.]MDW8116091.1 hypothetical protein [Geminocystis sp.]
MSAKIHCQKIIGLIRNKFHDIQLIFMNSLYASLLSFSLVTATGCHPVNGGLVTPVFSIQEIKQQENLNQLVTIEGKIVKTVPLLNSQAYQIQDNSSSIWVVVGNKLQFNPGQTVRLQGILKYQNITVEGDDWGEFYLEMPDDSLILPGKK